MSIINLATVLGNLVFFVNNFHLLHLREIDSHTQNVTKHTISARFGKRLHLALVLSAWPRITPAFDRDFYKIFEVLLFQGTRVAIQGQKKQRKTEWELKALCTLRPASKRIIFSFIRALPILTNHLPSGAAYQQVVYKRTLVFWCKLSGQNLKCHLYLLFS